jgi:hypothetical protein
MCQYRVGLVKNCRRCKSSIRKNCPLRKKQKNKEYFDTVKKGESKQ